MADFFISYTKADRAWAQWVAWHLREAGHSTELDVEDWRAGENFVLKMHAASANAGRMLAVLSPDYLSATYTQPEWAAAFVQNNLVPVRVRECELKGLLAAILYIDLLGLEEEAAVKALLAGVAGPTRLKEKPIFPGAAGTAAPIGERPRFPGTLPPVWNVPHTRNLNFTGREAELDALEQSLTPGRAAALTQAIHGLGGVGKTQTAVEYVYRHLDQYEAVWWVRAEQPSTLAADYAALAGPLGLPERAEPDQAAVVQAVRRHLGQSRRWLLVFDNADDPDAVPPYLPQGGGGQVLITSRSPHWGNRAQKVSVDVWDRPSAVAFLRKRTGQADEAAADALAEALGDLPLALEHAAAYCEQTGKSLAAYLKLYQARQLDLFRAAKPPADYHSTVTTTWRLAFDKVRAVPLASDLLTLCAFLAPDAIPRDVLRRALSGADESAWDEMAEDAALAALRSYSLVGVTDDFLSVHRLVQSALRDSLAAEERRLWAERAVRAVEDAFPYMKFETWPQCERLLPHALACARWIEEQDFAFAQAARLLNQAGTYLQARARYAEAEPLYRRALEINEATLGKEDPLTAVSLSNLAGLCQAQGRYPEAAPLLARALDIDEKVLGPEHPDTATGLNNLAGLYDILGQYDKAEALYRRALDIRERALGPGHPQTAAGLNNLALLCKNQRRYAEAEPLYVRALAIREASLGPEHPDTAQSLNNLASLYKAQRRHAEAEPLYVRALDIDEKVLGPEHPSTATGLNNLAELYRAQGRYQEAEPLHERALAIREKALGPQHPDTATSLNNLGGLYATQGRFAEAAPLVARALGIFEWALGKEHPNTKVVRAFHEAMQQRRRGAGG